MRKLNQFALILMLVLTPILTLDKLSWRFHHTLVIIYRIGIENISLYFDTASKKKVFIKSDTLEIAGDLYGTKSGENKKPGIILLHGASPYGRNLALYRVMAKEFSREGYIVLKIDLRGFGESDDARSLQNNHDLDESRDVINAVSYLISSTNVDVDKIYVVGHSHGGGVAIIAGSKDKRIKKIVAIGPPRRTLERMKNELKNIQQRFSHDRKLKKLVPIEVLQDLVTKSAIDNYLPYYSENGHQPIFLLDGELETSKDRLFLRNYYKKLTPPKKYMTISNTHHYLNTTSFFGTSLVFYEKKTIDRTIRTIVKWLR